MNATLGKTWFPLGDPNESARLRLFCFAHAGGNAMMFRDWQRHFDSGVQICPVQLPGHGTRFSEEPFSQMEPLIEAVAELMHPWFHQPFAFFGHSMGAALSYELSLWCSSRGVDPECLFVSGRRAPHRQPVSFRFDLPDKEFVEELRRLGGTPESAFADPELLAMFLPLLRADFRLIETLKYRPQTPLICPIVAISGAGDPQVKQEDVHAWVEMTSAQFAMHILPGDHFYINHSIAAVTRIVAERLRQCATRNRYEAPSLR